MISHHNRIRGRKPKQKRRQRTGWFNNVPRGKVIVRRAAPYLPASPMINSVRFRYYRGALIPRNEP